MPVCPTENNKNLRPYVPPKTIKIYRTLGYAVAQPPNGGTYGYAVAHTLR